MSDARMLLEWTSQLDIATEPNRRVGAVFKFPHDFVSRDESLSYVNRIELVCAVPWETLFLESLRHVYPRSFGAYGTRLEDMARREGLANVDTGSNHHGSRTEGT